MTEPAASAPTPRTIGANMPMESLGIGGLLFKDGDKVERGCCRRVQKSGGAGCFGIRAQGASPHYVAAQHGNGLRIHFTLRGLNIPMSKWSVAPMWCAIAMAVVWNGKTE